MRRFVLDSEISGTKNRMPRNDTLVTVIIPSYDRPDQLTQAIESVAQQTIDSIELLIVDDFSPTPVQTQIREIDLAFFSKWSIIRHSENRGAAAARATGLDHASGEYIAFLDDDDSWEPHKLERQLASFNESGSEVGISYTGMRHVGAEGNTIRTHEPTVEGNLTKTLLCRNVVGSYSTVMVRREAVEQTGSPDPSFPSWQDLEWYIRLSLNWEFTVVSEPLTIIHHDDDRDQISDDFHTIKTESFELFIEKFRPIAEEHGILFERKMMGWAAFRVGGYNALRTGHHSDARRFLFSAITWYPLEPIFWVYFLVALGGGPLYSISKEVKRILS